MNNKDLVNNLSKAKHIANSNSKKVIVKTNDLLTSPQMKEYIDSLLADINNERIDRRNNIIDDIINEE